MFGFIGLFFGFGGGQRGLDFIGIGDAVLDAPLATAQDDGLRHGGQVGAFAGEDDAEICVAAHDADAAQFGDGFGALFARDFIDDAVHAAVKAATDPLPHHQFAAGHRIVRRGQSVRLRR